MISEKAREEQNAAREATTGRAQEGAFYNPRKRGMPEGPFWVPGSALFVERVEETETEYLVYYFCFMEPERIEKGEEQ